MGRIITGNYHFHSYLSWKITSIFAHGALKLTWMSFGSPLSREIDTLVEGVLSDMMTSGRSNLRMPWSILGYHKKKFPTDEVRNPGQLWTISHVSYITGAAAQRRISCIDSMTTVIFKDCQVGRDARPSNSRHMFFGLIQTSIFTISPSPSFARQKTTFRRKT